MSPVRPTQAALPVECGHCGKKLAGVLRGAEGGVVYTVAPGYFEKHVRSGFDTPPPIRVFDATAEGSGEPVSQGSPGTVRIVCKCKREWVLRDSRMRALIEEQRGGKVLLS